MDVSGNRANVDGDRLSGCRDPAGGRRRVDRVAERQQERTERSRRLVQPQRPGRAHRWVVLVDAREDRT